MPLFRYLIVLALALASVPAFAGEALTSVVILRCHNNSSGQILVIGASSSNNADVDLSPPLLKCADIVARVMNAGFHLLHVGSTTTPGGETEYLFLGNSEFPVGESPLVEWTKQFLGDSKSIW